MIVSRHWVQYQGQGLAPGGVHSNIARCKSVHSNIARCKSVHSNTISDPLNCSNIQVSRTHNRHSTAVR